MDDQPQGGEAAQLPGGLRTDPPGKDGGDSGPQPEHQIAAAFPEPLEQQKKLGIAEGQGISAGQQDLPDLPVFFQIGDDILLLPRRQIVMVLSGKGPAKTVTAVNAAAIGDKYGDTVRIAVHHPGKGRKALLRKRI